MATKRVLTVAEVVEKLQDSGSEDEIGDESEDDFDGYSEETETEGWWNQKEVEDNNEEGNGSDSDKDSSNDNNTEEETDNDLSAVLLYTITPSCSATLTGNMRFGPQRHLSS